MKLDAQQLRWTLLGAVALIVLTIPFNCAVRQVVTDRAPLDIPDAEVDPDDLPDAETNFAQLNLPTADVTPVSPEQYGIHRYSARMLPETDDQWLMLMDENLRRNQSMEQLKQRGTLQSARMSKEDYDRRLMMIEQRMALLNKSSAPDAEQQRQTLRMLKASLISLQSAVVQPAEK